MASSTQIANMALRHLGNAKQIATLTENSEEATACNAFYDIALEDTLREFAWPFATKIASLGLITEDPNDEWQYEYSVPSDCLCFRRVLSGTRNDSRQSRSPYRIVYGDASTSIYSNVEDAEGEYTVYVDDTGRFSPDFTLALSYKLAALIAPAVTGGDPFKLGERALKMWDYQISKAASKAFNEEQAEEDPQAEFIRARE